MLNSTGGKLAQSNLLAAGEEPVTGSKVPSDLPQLEQAGHKNLDFTRLFFVSSVNRRCKSFYKNKSTLFIPNNLQSCIMHNRKKAEYSQLAT